MSNYEFIQANSELFAIYEAVYSDTDFDMCYDWNERLEDLRQCKECYFLYRDGQRIGGLTISSNTISNPFLIPPFKDRELFWNTLLEQMKDKKQEGDINISRIHQVDVDVLIAYGAKKKWTHQRMNRPTDILEIKTIPSYILVNPCEKDIQEIIQVVYNSHVHDITAQIYGKPNISDVENAIRRRFDSFSKTNTLHISVVAKEKETLKIVGVCIAGIYPDSANKFSTIHQLSVLPHYRRQGIAEMMMSYSISTAHSVSPVIGLGVLVGNPAENLYRKLGFAAEPSFTDLIFNI